MRMQTPSPCFFDLKRGLMMVWFIKGLVTEVTGILLPQRNAPSCVLVRSRSASLKKAIFSSLYSRLEIR
ncbi:hypothetical protein PVAG01_01742 [Phlyctema vagabunda]|uniref:Uncharacterized protein n=1 Tax=Phlyctema vagabunda TaxID=108571 RepID=A0ABR4PXY0_9HELO